MVIRLAVLALFLVAVVSAERSRGRLPTNEEASCPDGCNCDRTNVICRQTHHDDSVFGQIQAKAFPYLETIVMTDNTFRNIDFNIFESSPKLQSVSMVNFTNNHITHLSPETFENVPNVEYLYLSKNQIIKAGKNTFRPLQRLRLLEMNNALGDRSASSKADLLALMFNAKDPASFVELSEVILSGNSISMLHNETFCQISGLLRLDLSNNNLTSFNVPPGCLKTLKALDLSGNNFKRLPESLWESLPVMTTLDISNNPIECDCELQPFLHIARSENNDFANQGHTYCAGPPHLKGQNLFELRINLCQTSGYGFGTFFMLVLVGATALFGYRYYIRRRNDHGPPFQFGYSGLNLDEDVQPEFV